MRLLRSAFQAVQHNSGAVVLYIVVGTIVYSARLSLDALVIQPRMESLDDTLVRSSMFLSDIVAVIIMALARTVVFSRMGREIDRPMWRVATDGDALRLFFKLWLILDLASVAVIQILNNQSVNVTDDSTRLTLLLLWLLPAVMIVPFGASVMFYGRVALNEIRLALTTMLSEFPRTFVIFSISLMASMMLIGLQPQLPLWSRPALAVVDAYFDCYLFAAMWIVCMLHRDESSGPDDDFDF